MRAGLSLPFKPTRGFVAVLQDGSRGASNPAECSVGNEGTELVRGELLPQGGPNPAEHRTAAQLSSRWDHKPPDASLRAEELLSSLA